MARKKEVFFKDSYNDYIIGVDISMTDTGVAVYSMSEGEIVYVGHCNTEEVRDIKKYRGYNHNAIKMAMQREYFEAIRKRFPPRLVVFEQGFAKFRKEVEALNQINGVIYSIFWDCSQVKYAPTAVKAEIANGKAEKEHVRDVVLHNIPELNGSKDVYENDNISDAVAVLATHLLKEGIYKKAYWDKLSYGKTKKIKRIPKRPSVELY